MKKLIVFAGCSLLVIVGLVCWLAVRSVKRTATVKSDSVKGRPKTGNFPGITFSITGSDYILSETNGQSKFYIPSDSMRIITMSGSTVLKYVKHINKNRHIPHILSGDMEPPNIGKILFADSQRLALSSAPFPALYRDTTHSFFPTMYVYSPRIDTFVIGDNAGNVSTFLRNGTVIWETSDKAHLDSVYRWFAINLLIEKEYMDSIKREEDKYKKQ